MSDQLKLDQPHRPTDRSSSSRVQNQSVQPALNGASYVIGRVLGEIWQDSLMDLDELLVASSMCFNALAEGKSAISFGEISRMSGRKPSRTQHALQQLALAGFVRRRHPSHFGLESEELFYELQLPIDCSLS